MADRRINQDRHLKVPGRTIGPDFVAAQNNDGKTDMWLIETKGWEQADVPLKDARASEWCQDASKLTGITWRYLKVRYVDYMAMTGDLSRWPAATFTSFLTGIKKYSKQNQGALVE